MKVLEARNPHSALIKAIPLLQAHGQNRSSRGGDVIVMPCPVTTVYERPIERVIFWPQRDANPFFHLYESLWMLAGRNDVAPLLRYAKNMGNYADYGLIHGGYGKRWRNWFELHNAQSSHGAYGLDQLEVIAERLIKDPTDRRSVLGMWDPRYDLGARFKDVPCNTIASFQRQEDGSLDITVFCRSNDIIWGAYGANAVQFSVLLEYMAMWIGCPVGKYYQVSVNWHAYRQVWDPLVEALDAGQFLDTDHVLQEPYRDGKVYPALMQGPVEKFDSELHLLLSRIDEEHPGRCELTSPFLKAAYRVLKAHEIYRNHAAPEKYDRSLDWLEQGPPAADWIVAAKEWILRRRATWQGKMRNE